MSRLRRAGLLLLSGWMFFAAPLRAQGGSAGTPDGLLHWLDALSAGLAEVEESARMGRTAEAQQRVLRLYLDYYERIEAYYGPGAPYAAPTLSKRVAATERRFQKLLQASEPSSLAALAAGVREDIERIRAAALAADVPLQPAPPDPVASAPAPANVPETAEAETPEVQALLERLAAAERAYRAGRTQQALTLVEQIYLEGFEPLEARLPSDVAGRVERLIHLSLRPQLAGGAPAAEVERSFAALRAALLEADAALTAPTSFWFGAVNSFVIIVREGLEAVLLIGALLAYLSRVAPGQDRYRRQIYGGVILAIAASFATWIAARTLIPISGASREILEGVTALLAVVVLLYVSHWLFQKTYIHDWKDYLRERVGEAITTKSALAMTGLAFAAVYREGFETVLFYQALLYDTGTGAVLAGFVPGALLILGVGVGIIRLGMRLPLRKVFTVTNAILLYLAFTFLGKGIFELLEAGLITPHRLPWFPDHPALQLVFGLYPVAETLLAQAAFLVMLGLTYIYYRRRKTKQETAAASETVPA